MSLSNHYHSSKIAIEQPIAMIHGEAYTQLPPDLYIPPDALEICLEAFTGPLDLLLYLIRKHNLDILDIPIAEIAKQYQQYIDLMQILKLELAAEYLVMGAILADIKSRLLLPKPTEFTEEEDPRSELVRRLKEYEQFKQAAEQLDALPRVERDIFLVSITPLEAKSAPVLPDVSVSELLKALSELLQRASWRVPHVIRREILSVRARMSRILEVLDAQSSVIFEDLLDIKEGRLGVVVTLSAILELLKHAAIRITQHHAYAPIVVVSGGIIADNPENSHLYPL